jgi:hypothetical protein
LGRVASELRQRRHIRRPALAWFAIASRWRDEGGAGPPADRDAAPGEEARWRKTPHARTEAGNEDDGHRSRRPLARTSGSPTPNDENLALEDNPNWRHDMAADNAIRAARPMTPAGGAIQVRVLEESLKVGRSDGGSEGAPVSSTAPR